MRKRWRGKTGCHPVFIVCIMGLKPSPSRRNLQVNPIGVWSPFLIERLLSVPVVETSPSMVEQGNTGKWLAFVESKDEGRRVKSALQHSGISVAFVSSDKMEPDDAQVLSDVLFDGSYKVHVLLATSVIDNGVSIVDQSVSNLVISGFEAIQAIQQVGRIRLQSPEKTVRLFVCRYRRIF